MDAFRRFAVFTIARDAVFVALAAVTMMVAFSFELALAFAIGATIELLFALGLLLRFARLSDERIVRTEAWLILMPPERPVGESGRRSARHDLEDVLLTFAKAAAGVAVMLYSSSLIYFLVNEPKSLHAILSVPLG
jgi:hypothetical protein